MNREYPFETWAEFIQHFEAMCEDNLYGRWNVPVWIDNEGEDEFEFGPEVRLGVSLTRKDDMVTWVVPFESEEALLDLKARVLRVWAGRAETGFALHPPLIERVTA